MNPSPVANSVYAFAPRILRRWAEERLRIVAAPGGGFEATFSLEGSTCGNVAFHLEYRVECGPRSSGFAIRSLACRPAPGDTNHREMCAAKSGDTRLAESISWIPPLGGLSLDAALAWQPTTTPDGCLCAEAARAHKWRAVIHTLHLALHTHSR